MDDVFIPVVIGVSLLAVIAAVIALATSSGSYEGIGGDRALPPDAESATPPDRETEIRQLLEARNARRTARGEEPVDVEAELRSLAATTPPDAGLAAEVRQFVEARNARRIARGEPPLDVDAEVSARLREL